MLYTNALFIMHEHDGRWEKVQIPLTDITEESRENGCYNRDGESFNLIDHCKYYFVDAEEVMEFSHDSKYAMKFVLTQLLSLG